MILLDYHLRVGQITHDTHVPAAQTVAEQRLDETEIGEGTTITFIDAKWPDGSRETSDAPGISNYLGLRPNAAEMSVYPGRPEVPLDRSTDAIDPERTSR